MSHPTYNILIADDEPGFRSLLREWLEGKVREKLPGTYVIYESGDGQKAIEQAGVCKASGSSLDMAVIDLRMPGKNGFQTIDELLQISPSTKVMVLSAITDFFIRRLREYGTTVMPLGKPITRKDFIEAAIKILQSGNNYE